MAKSPDAFRTISEVADWLGVQAHVLRFWESKFSQVKPIKRAGGRRYYRPADMLLIGGIKKLLHDDGLTIKGVQKILREEGMSHVADMSQALDDTTLDQLDDMPAAPPVAELPMVEPEEEKGVVLNFEARDQEDDLSLAEEESASPATEEAEAAPETKSMPAEKPLTDAAPQEDASIEDTVAPTEEAASDGMAAPAPQDPVEAALVEPVFDAPPAPADVEASAAEDSVAPKQVEPPSEAPAVPSFMRHPAEPETTPEPAEPEAEEPAPTTFEDTSNTLPAFLRRPMDEPAATAETPVEPEPASATPEAEPAPGSASAPKPRVVDVAPFTPEAEFDAVPTELSAVYRIKRIDPARARQIAPLMDRLTTLRDSMNAQRRSASAPPS